jgi:Haemolysin-III related
MNHSQKMDAFGAQLDFQGVILLMWGATVPLLYYGFYCDIILQRAYSTLVSSLKLVAPQPVNRGKALGASSIMFHIDFPATVP